MTERSSAEIPDRKARWEQVMRDAIVQGVVQVLLHDGVDKLTMDRVAQRAGVAKGTLYSYFQDKKDLIEQALAAAFEPLSTRLEDIAAEEAPARDKLEAMIRTHLTYFEEHRETLRVLLLERQRAWKRSRPRGERWHAYAERVAEVLEAGVREGAFRPVPSRKVAGMLVDACISLITDRLFSEGPGALDDDIRLVAEVFLGGIEV